MDSSGESIRGIAGAQGAVMSFAYWRKCDFQLHSSRDPNWSGPRPIGVGEDVNGQLATVADVDRERQLWADSFVDGCVARGLEAIGLTDHHEMVMVPYVQETIARRKAADPSFDLWLFPGMELTARGGVQCLILFDADLSDDWRREALGKLGIVIADLDDKAIKAPRVTQLTCSYPEIASELDTVQKLVGRYIVLPNVSQGGRHTVLRDGAHADFKTMTYVGGYLDNGQTVETLQQTNRTRLSGTDPMWGERYIYPLPTSDARSANLANVGTNNCWIKLAAPTAEAFRQAFLGYQSRISVGRPTVSNLSVSAIRLTGSTILTDASLPFSPEQNAFIGGRGSGKSSYLEYVAFGLGRSCFDPKKTEYSGSDRNAALIKDTIISAGAGVELDVLQDGARFKITRTGGNSYQPQVTYPDGSILELSTKELRSLFPAVVYSQGELSEIGKQAGILNDRRIADDPGFAVIVVQHRQIGLERVLRHQRAMCRGDELDGGKMRGEVAADRALPLRVEMQIDFVDDNDRRLEQRVRAIGIMVEQPPCDIGGPGHDGLISKAHPADRHNAEGGLDPHPAFLIIVSGQSRPADIDIVGAFEIGQDFDEERLEAGELGLGMLSFLEPEIIEPRQRLFRIEQFSGGIEQRVGALASC